MTQRVIDPVTGIEVLYAPERAERSHALVHDGLELPEDAFCPFCPGHEAHTPPEIARWPEEPTWQGRIIPNRFPIVDTNIQTKPRTAIYPYPGPPLPAYGRHELIIESPRHHDTWLTQTSSELVQILGATQARVRSMFQDEQIQCVQVFKNMGVRAGASLSHPHLQIVGLGFLPASLERTKPAPLSRETDELYLSPASSGLSRLLLDKTDHFVAYCPPVSLVPYQMRIQPRCAVPYPELSSAQSLELAILLQKALRLLFSYLGPTAHNVLWQIPPRRQQPHYWHLDIMPRLTTMAGLEWLTQLHVNPILPVVAAEHLRQGAA
ncbi:MAG TPA: DUF4931 domain-containing protein [Gemmatales bacterium]|nr:DUF4931 domain-containing protein [Gemmatales bacterium]